MPNVSLIDGHLDNAEHCVCCGQIIPEGRQVCIICGKKVDTKVKADVVEVVKCKDCKHSDLYCGNYRCENSQTPWVNDEFAIFVEPTDFCSYGERKEDGEG